MVLYREIPRTAAFAWSPGSDLPIVATGTKAGVVDTEFSNESVLELWNLNLGSEAGKREPEVITTVKVDERFHDLDWHSSDGSKGYIAGALQSGVVKVWDANKIFEGSGETQVYASPSQDHAMKRVKFSPFLKSIIASTDAAGGLHITNLETGTTTSPVAMGTSGSIDALDWNKKTATILATGDSLGTISIVKTDAPNPVLSIKKPGGCLSSSISSIAWDPERITSVAAGVTIDGQYKVVIWDMRNTSTPVRELLGNTSPVTSLSWCQQDADLLLSSSQDYQTCWNPHSGNQLVQFSSDSSIRGVFETRFNDHNPSLFASASFEKSISILSIQNTKPNDGPTGVQTNNAADDDFFDKFRAAPKSNTFSISQAPKWLQRPIGAKFGFGGKLVVFAPSKVNPRQSNLQILDYAIDSSIKESSQAFADSLSQSDLTDLLEERINNAESDEDKADWSVIQALMSSDIRSKIPEYLGFPPQRAPSPEPASGTDTKDISIIEEDDAAFFDNFTGITISETTAEKPTAPFQIHSPSASPTDTEITKALVAGSFNDALKTCQDADRWTDAFMIAVCGGEQYINKVKEAYLAKNPPTSSYMRLVSSISSKNLPDLVANADLVDWKDIMATICTFASKSEFSELAEALGDRLQNLSHEKSTSRKDATFCYLVSSKLEKVVTNWIQELKEREDLDAKTNKTDDLFSIHAKFLQKFIEKVTVFRKVTDFNETDRDSGSDWKLSALYSKYLEYADVVASVGKLDIAENYLNLLPAKFSDVETAQRRVRPNASTTATTQAAPRNVAPSRPAAVTSAYQQARAPVPSAAPSTLSPYGVPHVSSGYTPGYTSGYAPGAPMGQQFSHPPASRYGPGPGASGPQAIPPPPKASGPLGPPPRTETWNDLPEGFVTAPKRPASAASHARIIPPTSTSTPPPPPRAGTIPPPPMSTTPVPGHQIARPPSTSSHLYAPPVGTPIRAASPYDQSHVAPGPPKGSYIQRPASGQAAPSSRYAPSISSVGGQTTNPSPTSSFGAPPPPHNRVSPAPPVNPYSSLGHSAAGAPPNPYSSMASNIRPGSVQAATPPPPPPKGPMRQPPRGPYPGAVSTPPPPRVSSTQSPSHLGITESNLPSDVPVTSNGEVLQVYETIKSMWASVAPRHSDKATESRTLQSALDNLGSSIHHGSLSPQTQDLLLRVGNVLPDYRVAKDTCRDSMGAVPPTEKIFVATIGKILVAMGSAAAQ